MQTWRWPLDPGSYVCLIPIQYGYLTMILLYSKTGVEYLLVKQSTLHYQNRQYLESPGAKWILNLLCIPILKKKCMTKSGACIGCSGKIVLFPKNFFPLFYIKSMKNSCKKTKNQWKIQWRKRIWMVGYIWSQFETRNIIVGP